MADTTPPTIAITSNKTALKAGDTALITFTLSEPATDFVFFDVATNGGTLSNFTGSASSYSATFTPNQNSTVEGSVSVGNFKFSDESGNANLDGEEANNHLSIAIDTRLPAVATVWTRLIGSSEQDEAVAITTGIDGSIYVAGSTSGSIDDQTNSGASDVFITKFTPGGTKLWTQLFGTSSQVVPPTLIPDTPGTNSDDVARAIATGPDGSVYVAGSTGGSIDEQPFSGGGRDAFVSNFNPNGERLWTRLIGSTGYDVANAIVTGADGSIYVAGSTSGNLDGLVNAGGSDAFISKYSANGTRLWTKSIGGTDYPTSGFGTEFWAGPNGDIAYALTIGIDGSIYVAGSVSGTVDGQTNTGYADGFIAKFNPQGSKVWTKLIGSSLGDWVTALATNADGSILLLVQTFGSLVDPRNESGQATYLVAIDADGTKLWTRYLGQNKGFDLSTSIDGSIYVSGQVAGNLYVQTGLGEDDAFVSRFYPDGTLGWTKLVGSIKSDWGTGVVEGVDGSIYLSGWTNDSLDGQMNAGGRDAFLVKLNVLDPSTQAPTIAISSNRETLGVGENATITFTLSKPSTNFTLADITVEGGTLTNFQGFGTSYSVTLTAGLDASIGTSVSVGSGKFSDALGQFNEDGADADNAVLITADTTSRTISKYPTTGHYYEFVGTTEGIRWTDALDEAAKQSYLGLQGYLVTLTSEQEDSFVYNEFSKFASNVDAILLGATDQESEGVWKWADGPEKGREFWLGKGSNAGGQPINGEYSNWGGVEPNDSGAYQTRVPGVYDPQDWLVYLPARYNALGKWADNWINAYGELSNTPDGGRYAGYIVEYGGLPATYAINSSSASVNEGSSVTFTIDTKNIEWGKTVSYTLTGISQSDLSSGSLTGTATVNQNGVDGRATVTVNLANDQTTEGAESLRLTVESTTSSAVTVNDASHANEPLSGMGYHWKSHVLLSDVTVTSFPSKVVEANYDDRFDLRSATLSNNGTKLTVDLWLNNAALGIGNFNFTAETTGAVAASFIPALDSTEWTITSNTANPNRSVVAGYLKSASEMVSGSVKVGTFSLDIAAGAFAPINFTNLKAGTIVLPDTTLTGITVTSNSDGRFEIITTNLSEQLLVPKLSSGRNPSIFREGVTAADALAALMIAVELNPNPDPDGNGPMSQLRLSPYQVIAADVNSDSVVDSLDALTILKMAIGRADAPAPQWIFVSEQRDFWNEASGVFTLDRLNAGWDTSIRPINAAELNLVGLVKGDVNGSWRLTGASTVEATNPNYFKDLAQLIGVPADQWGVAPE